VTVTVSDWTAGDCAPAGRRDRAVYRLCYAGPADRALEVLSDGRSREIAVEDPPGARLGYWGWAALSPDGTAFVATWWSDCGAPIAFTFPVEGGTPVPVAGPADWTQAPDSEAVGWTSGGDPIVRLLYTACGPARDVPGTYVYADGTRRRVDDVEPSLDARDV
jgi:hypothetical protein